LIILRYLSCPSQTELKLLTSLVSLFDAYIYNPYLHHLTNSSQQSQKNDNPPYPAIRALPGAIDTQINALYSTLMTLLANYQRWIRNLTTFKQTYMTPIMRRIQDSPWIQREIEQTEAALEAAKLASTRSIRPSSTSVTSANAQGHATEQQVALAPPGLAMTAQQVRDVVQWAEKRRALQKGHGNTKSEGNNRRVKGRYKREYTI
jgi:hypothetical protein